MASGEYECRLEQSDCLCAPGARGAADTGAALRFTRELWSRQFVLKHVAPELLARSENHAMLHPGHVVINIDGIAVSGLSMRRFTELWIPADASDTEEDELGEEKRATVKTTTTRVVRFCDRKRADLERAMIKDLVSSDKASELICSTRNPNMTLTKQEVSECVAQCQAWMWDHKLQDAQDKLHALVAIGGAADPMLLLLRLEMELIRVLISNDALIMIRARQTAKQALRWLQLLCDLPSLSFASALVMRASLTEALLLSSALQIIAEKNVKAMAQFRRCAAVYAELSGQLKSSPSHSLPASLRHDLGTRLRFGLGILQLSSVTAMQGLEWLGAIIMSAGGFDPAQALDNLLECCRDPANARATWASLALFHSSSAIRMLQNDNDGSSGIIQRKYALQVAQLQQQYLQRYPNSVLHLWSASLNESNSQQGENSSSSPSSLEHLTRAVALSSQEEHAHLLRFDAGYRHFVNLNFDVSTPMFMEICKCASAPSKLRGLGSIFLAAGYLFSFSDGEKQSTSSSSPWPQLLDSVRLLLRSSLRFLDETKVKDAEAACLAQRMTVYLNSPDWYLHLLPCEILYVYCVNYSTSTNGLSNEQQNSLHERALAYLDRFQVRSTSVACMGLLRFKGKVIKLNASRQSHQHQSFSLDAQAICEWSVLRASVLYHLGDFESALQQLETLQELLLQVPSNSFVPALVSFYRLQILFRQSLDLFESPAREPGGALGVITPALQFEYSYIYAGKLRALAAVLTSRRMSCKTN